MSSFSIVAMSSTATVCPQFALSGTRVALFLPSTCQWRWNTVCPARGPDVDDHAVVLEALGSGDGGHEPQHPAGFLVRELVDLAERVDVPLGQDEQVRLGGGLNVADRDEAVGGVHVVAARDEAGRRGSQAATTASTPSSATPTASAGTSAPIGASTSHGV